MRRLGAEYARQYEMNASLRRRICTSVRNECVAFRVAPSCISGLCAIHFTCNGVADIRPPWLKSAENAFRAFSPLSASKVHEIKRNPLYEMLPHSFPTSVILAAGDSGRVFLPRIPMISQAHTGQSSRFHTHRPGRWHPDADRVEQPVLSEGKPCVA